jgi:hypothetical protein
MGKGLRNFLITLAAGVVISNGQTLEEMLNPNVDKEIVVETKDGDAIAVIDIFEKTAPNFTEKITKLIYRWQEGEEKGLHFLVDNSQQWVFDTKTVIMGAGLDNSNKPTEKNKDNKPPKTGYVYLYRESYDSFLIPTENMTGDYRVPLVGKVTQGLLALQELKDGYVYCKVRKKGGKNIGDKIKDIVGNLISPQKNTNSEEQTQTEGDASSVIDKYYSEIQERDKQGCLNCLSQRDRDIEKNSPYWGSVFDSKMGGTRIKSRELMGSLGNKTIYKILESYKTNSGNQIEEYWYYYLIKEGGNWKIDRFEYNLNLDWLKTGKF